MKPLQYLFGIALLWSLQACGQTTPSAGEHSPLTAFPPVINTASAYNTLTEKEAYVIEQKGTERAYSGEYHNSKEAGTYLCRRCNLPLFRSEDKFDSRSGWPSFDDMIGQNVKQLADADGMRTEIVCANCEGHLGHVFHGEGFTRKQTRHCVNSLSLQFVRAALPKK